MPTSRKGDAMPATKAKTPPVRSSFPFREFKALDEQHGTFSGYLAVFNTEDQNGDIIEPGAFKNVHPWDDGWLRLRDQRRSSPRKCSDGLAHGGETGLWSPPMNGLFTRILLASLLTAAATSYAQQANPDAGFVAPKRKKTKVDTATVEKPSTVDVTGVAKQAITMK